jgi:hypothetical protein
MLTDAEKVREISSQLALLPYFGGDMSKHILVKVGPYHNGDGNETTALRYRLISDLKHQSKASDAIFAALTATAEKLGISVVTTY